MRKRAKAPGRASANATLDQERRKGAFEPRGFEAPSKKAARSAPDPGRADLLAAYLERKSRLDSVQRHGPGVDVPQGGVTVVDSDSPAQLQCDEDTIANRMGMHDHAVQRQSVSKPKPSLKRAMSPPTGVIQRADYPYGAANSVPHIHRYGTSWHLKIVNRDSVKRYNLVVDGKKAKQDVQNEAFEAAKGNADLLSKMRELLRDADPYD